MGVFVCTSGELVVIHDYKVDRTTNREGYFFEKSFQELRKLERATDIKFQHHKKY